MGWHIQGGSHLHPKNIAAPAPLSPPAPLHPTDGCWDRSCRCSCQCRCVPPWVPGTVLPLMDANVSPGPFVLIWCQPAARGDAARAGHAAHLPRAAPGTAQPARHRDASAGVASATKTSQRCSAHPHVCTQGASPGTLQALPAQHPSRAGGTRGGTPVCRTTCTSLCHGVPMSPRQHRWDFGLGVNWGAGNIEPLWLWAQGIHWEAGGDLGARRGWDRTSWPRSSFWLPMVTCGHPRPRVPLPSWLCPKGTVTLLLCPTRFQDGASPPELLVRNF